MSIDAILAGVPVIACDEGNFAWAISSNSPREVENIRLATDSEVSDWLHHLAWCQWTPDEMESGAVIEHLRPIIEQLVADDVADVQ